MMRAVSSQPAAVGPSVSAPAEPDAAANLSSAPPADGADPWTRSGGMPALHPGVQHIAYAAPNGAGGSGPAPAVHDVATTKQADIDRMKKDPAQRRLAHTIENAKAAYGDLLAKGARIVVTTSAGNGGHPVVTVMGAGFDAKKDARVHTHYHGDNATVGDPLGSKAGQNARIREAIARDPQTVFVLPEARNSTARPDSPKNNNDYDASWLDVKSQAQTTDDALKAAGITRIGKEIVSFHSGGGKVPQVLMGADKSGAGLRADRLELYDSLYGDRNHDWKKGPDPRGWEKAVVDWKNTAAGQAAEVVYYHGSNMPARQKVLEKDLAGKKLVVVDMKDQGPVNGTNNPVATDSNGNTWRTTVVVKNRDGTTRVTHPPAREFNPDPHYRTTGQFLATRPGP